MRYWPESFRPREQMNWRRDLQKRMEHIRAGVLLAAALGGMYTDAFAQRANVEEMLQRHAFVFIAEGATGRSIPRRVLMPTYELRITSDSVDGRLPFYGRVYSPSEAYNTATEGFTIRSRLKSYELRKKRNGTWQLTVIALSGNNVQKLTFSISRDGSANLSTNSALRDMMFYDGRIEPAQRP